MVWQQNVTHQPHETTGQTSILFVCHANICRSPMAEAVMRDLVRNAGLSDSIRIDAAGTHAHVGEPAYYRTQETLRDFGVVSVPSPSRQLEHADLTTFDYVLAMDRRNLTFMLRYSAGATADIRLFLSFAQQIGMISTEEVRDPFPDGDYQQAYHTIRTGCMALLRHLQLERRR